MLWHIRHLSAVCGLLVPRLVRVIHYERYAFCRYNIIGLFQYYVVMTHAITGSLLYGNINRLFARHILPTNDSYSFFSLVTCRQWIILTYKTRIYRAWSEMG
jgi:hypothetical protein